MSRTVAIVQARTGSHRLPGKVLADLGGAPILTRVLDAARAASHLDAVVLAVPEGDEPLLGWGDRLPGLVVHEGPEDDVLGRYLGAAAGADADVIVRLTSDCPLLDPELVDLAVDRFAEGGLDLASLESYPRGTGDVEVCSRDALERSGRAAPSGSPHREHVMTWMATHPDQFAVLRWHAEGSRLRPDLRVCVDTDDDLAAVRALWARLAPTQPPGVDEVIAALDADPTIVDLNRHVQQKPPPSP